MSPCILKAVGIFLILLVVGAKLTGLFVRSFVTAISPGNLPEPHRQRIKLVNLLMPVFNFLLIAGYLYAIYYFWTLSLVLCALGIMACRLPDLIWEIRTGNKVTLKNAPIRGLFPIIVLALLGALLFVWYLFCR